MADNKSREVYVFICMSCDSEFHVKKSITLEGKDCPLCDGPLIPKHIQGIDYSDVKLSKVKVDIDVSDALKGLKSVQREARKAIKALKELKLHQERFPSCCEDFEVVTMRATDGRIVSKTKRCNKCGWSND